MNVKARPFSSAGNSFRAFFPPSGRAPLKRSFHFAGQFDVGAAVGSDLLVPFLFELGAPGLGLAVKSQDVVRET
jgi:hypothetical protein